MNKIHSTAIVDPAALLGNDIEIGPYCVIEPTAVIGDGCCLGGHVVIKGQTELGPGNQIEDFVVLGGRPQHLQAEQQIGLLQIGADNVIREHATIHRALKPQAATVVGDNNMIMVGVHIGHDTVVGNRTIIANNVLLAGHTTIEDHAYLSGAAGLHQFCRVGQYAMIGGQAHITRDVPPYVTVDGESSRIVGLNLIGLRRQGFSDESIAQLKAAYRVIYRSGLKWTEVITQLRSQFKSGPATEFVRFLSEGQRGFVPERKPPAKAILKLHAPAEENETHRDAA